MGVETVGIAPVIAATEAPGGLAVSHAATPVQGIGVQLLDDGPPGVPDHGRPDVYIGAQDDGLLPAPIAAGTSQTWTVQVSNPGTITEQVSVYPAPASLRNGAWLPASAGADDASSWTGASPASLSLAPGASGRRQA